MANSFSSIQITTASSILGLSEQGGYITEWKVRDSAGNWRDILYIGTELKRTGIPILFPYYGPSESGFDSGGNIKVAQGSTEALDNSTTSGATCKFIRAPQFPPIPDTMCPFAYVTVLVGSAAAAWTFGTSNLTGPPASTGINFVDIQTLPDRVQVA